MGQDKDDRGQVYWLSPGELRCAANGVGCTLHFAFKFTFCTWTASCFDMSFGSTLENPCKDLLAGKFGGHLRWLVLIKGPMELKGGLGCELEKSLD